MEFRDNKKQFKKLEKKGRQRCQKQQAVSGDVFNNKASMTSLAVVSNNVQFGTPFNHSLMALWFKVLLAVSHHCLGSNPTWGMRESCQ